MLEKVSYELRPLRIKGNAEEDQDKTDNSYPLGAYALLLLFCSIVESVLLIDAYSFFLCVRSGNLLHLILGRIMARQHPFLQLSAFEV